MVIDSKSNILDMMEGRTCRLVYFRSKILDIMDDDWFKIQISSAKYKVPSTKFQIPDTIYQAPNTEYQVPNTKY